MPRTMQIEFSGFTDPVWAELDDAEARHLTDEIWEDLAAPVRMWTSHTSATGDWYTARGRPDAHPHAVGTQAAPLGRSVDRVKLPLDLGRNLLR